MVAKMSTTLEFIHSTPSSKPGQADRKRIRSHVLRARARRSSRPVQKPWTNPELSHLPDVGKISGLSYSAIPVPRCICSDIAMVRFPHEIEPYMLRDLHEYIITMRTGLSPFEACVQVHNIDDQLFAYMMGDPLMFHLALFQVRVHFDSKVEGGCSSPATLSHLTKLLSLLQKRLDSLPLAISDQTILVVIALTMAAHDSGNESAAMKHMAGLRKIVSLRGGVRALTHKDHRIQRKVCKVDLSVALRFGVKPVFFCSGLDWRAYLANTHLLKHNANDAENGSLQNTAFAEQNLDTKLRNIWADLREFSLVAELAYQTEGTIEPSLVNEVTISTMYRLLHLCFDHNTLDELIRLGLLTYATTIFLQGQVFSTRYAYLVSRLRQLITASHTWIDRLPPAIRLWLTVTLASIASTPTQKTWLAKTVDVTIGDVKPKTWLNARTMLKSVMWVGFVHDFQGQVTVESSISRLKWAGVLE